MSWQDIFGNAARIAHLRKILAERRFPHAVIFSGVAGIGKKKIAETCATTLLCENPVNGEACGVCRSCRLIQAAGHPDFLVVEPEETKSTPVIKIDQIRKLQAQTALKPDISNCRVVIIDGAEFMNNPAANCLLKTLEEPTGQSIFILLTANRAGLLMTMRSRCVTLNFEKISAAEIKSALERRNVDSARAEIISLVADGSFGRALKLVESGGYELREDALTLLENLLAKKISVEDIFSKGAEVSDWSREQFGDFISHVQKILRDVCLIDSAELYNRDLNQRLNRIKIPPEKIYELLEEGTEIQRRLKSNASLRLLAESYFLRLRMTLDTK